MLRKMVTFLSTCSFLLVPEIKLVDERLKFRSRFKRSQQLPAGFVLSQVEKNRFSTLFRKSFPFEFSQTTTYLMV